MRFLFSFLIVLSILFSSCEPTTNNPCATDFDELSLLSNIGNNIIAPTYQTLATEADDLNTLAVTFVGNPTVTNLNNLRAQLQQIWLTWQTAYIFEFGPASTENLRSFMNNFPVFKTRLEERIHGVAHDLSAESSSFIRGFPAMDYLLYGIEATDAAIVDLYVNDTYAANRKQYVLDLAALIAQKANAVNDAWKATGGNYLNTFVSTKGKINGKPLSDLVNQLNLSYELFKNNKVGTPISAKTGYLPLRPESVEAYYSRKSLGLAIAAVEANKKVFMGFTNGANNTGLDDYLMATGAKKGGVDLHTVIINQYDLAINSLMALQPLSLHDAIVNNLDGVKTAYAAAQNQLVHIKTDMPSTLCINITYADAVDDGD